MATVVRSNRSSTYERLFYNRKSVVYLAVLLLLIMVAILTGFSIFSQYQKKGGSELASSITPVLDNESGVGIKLKDFKRSQTTKDGALDWEIRAKEGKYFPSAEKVDLINPILDIHNEDNVKINLVAKHALVLFSEEALNEAVASGDAVITHSDGLKISSESFVFNNQEESIESKTPVTIDGESFSGTGDAMSFNLSNKDLELKGNVYTVFQRGEIPQLPN